MLKPAQRAVGQGDYSAALKAIARHRRRFPRGVLAEEREALRVKALRGLGRTAEARGAADSFRRRFPHSALSDTVTAPGASQE
jgi:outer membrane protein assembly factor BamD (BamD/ComL family)